MGRALPQKSSTRRAAHATISLRDWSRPRHQRRGMSCTGRDRALPACLTILFRLRIALAQPMLDGLEFVTYEKNLCYPEYLVSSLPIVRCSVVYPTKPTQLGCRFFTPGCTKLRSVSTPKTNSFDYFYEYMRTLVNLSLYCRLCMPTCRRTCLQNGQSSSDWVRWWVFLPSQNTVIQSQLSVPVSLITRLCRCP